MFFLARRYQRGNRGLPRAVIVLTTRSQAGIRQSPLIVFTIRRSAGQQRNRTVYGCLCYHRDVACSFVVAHCYCAPSHLPARPPSSPDRFFRRTSDRTSPIAATSVRHTSAVPLFPRTRRSIGEYPCGNARRTGNAAVGRAENRRSFSHVRRLPVGSLLYF